MLGSVKTNNKKIDFKMKIGILTLIGEYNYGNLLQSYAMQTILERLGHQVVVLNRRCDSPDLKLYCLRVLSLLKSIVLRFFLRREDILIVNPFVEKYAYDIKNRINKFHLIRFAKQYTNRSIPLRSTNDLTKYIKRESFDAYVVGSDQVWREEYTFSIHEMFLSFLSNESKAKRLAYAASFGVNENYITEEKMPQCVELLKKFAAVSVREKSAVKICKDYFGVEAKHVLDPTMLLQIEDYIKIFERNNTPKSIGNLLVYVLDDNDEIKQAVELFSKQNKLTPFKVNEIKKVKSYSYAYKLQSLETWLRGFYDAKCIITDSFHACVFSILFNKPFICVGNKNRGNTRFNSLLGVFGLENRMVADMSMINEKMSMPIDWMSVNSILEEKKSESMFFLENALNN